MTRVERGNVVLNVKDDEVQHYLLLGYSVTDKSGRVLREAIPTDFATLQKYYIEQKNRVTELESIVAKLTTENAELSAKLKASDKDKEIKTTRARSKEKESKE